MEIYIIRHTTPEIQTGICYGQSNINVTNTFTNELEQYKKELPTHFDKIYSSDLIRCIVLAEKFGNIITDQRLRELNFGDWEMKKWNEINEKDIKHWSENFDFVAPPNGETFNNLIKRVKSFLEEIKKQKNQKILIVTHAGVIRAFWTILLQIPPINAFKIPVEYGEIFVFNAKYNNIIRKK